MESDVLVRLYRYGPLRHRVRKCWVIHGADPRSIVERLRAVGLPGGITLQAPPPRRGALWAPVWLDSGRRLVHDEEARRVLFTDLAAGTAMIGEAAARAGGVLLPTAVDLAPGGACFAPDLHTIEVESADAVAAVSNRLRVDTAVIVGASGRAVARRVGVDPSGSARHARGDGTVRGPWLPSAHPDHLARVGTQLRRMGYSGLDALDVGPEPQDGALSLTVRLIDGQALLSTTRAWLLVLHALALRGRRHAREGVRAGEVSRDELDLHRVSAIGQGVHATVGWGEPSDRGRQPVATVPLALFHLLEGLRLELRILGATFDEIAPLWSGAALRASGRSGLVTENELFRLLLRDRQDLAVAIASAARTQSTTYGPSLGSVNERRQPGPFAVLREQWNARPTERLDLPNILLVGRVLSDCSGEDLANALVAWQEDTNGFDLWDALKGLPDDDRERALARLRPPTMRVLTEPTGWSGLAGALEAASIGNACLLRLEAPTSRAEAVDRVAKDLLATTPPGFALLRLRRMRQGAVQELLVVKEVA